MLIEVNATYLDRKGQRWTVDHVLGQRIAPVTAHQMEGKNFRTRTFQQDGTYWHAGSGYEGKPDSCGTSSLLRHRCRADTSR